MMLLLFLWCESLLLYLNMASALVVPMAVLRHQRTRLMAGRQPSFAQASPSAAGRLVVVPDQAARLKRLEKFTVLVLNRDYAPLSFMPLSVWHWQDAVKAVFQDRVEVLESYDLAVRSTNVVMRLPAVVVLKKYEPRKKVRPPRFSKRLLVLRDDNKCQYCESSAADLTADHVVPRSKGGTTSWDNIVACCKQCNAKKKNLLLSQVQGMSLKRKPTAPTPFQLEAIAKKHSLSKLKRSTTLHDTWKHYLFSFLDDDGFYELRNNQQDNENRLLGRGEHNNNNNNYDNFKKKKKKKTTTKHQHIIHTKTPHLSSNVQ